MTQVLRFDGVNDHVTMPVLPDMTGNWQAEFKVTIRANVNTVIAGESGSTRLLQLLVPTGQVRVKGIAGVSYDVVCPMTLGETCTILVTSTVSPARLTVFKNGVQTGQLTYTQGMGGLLYIGRGGSGYANLDLYSFRIWDGTVDRLYSAAGLTTGTVLPDLNNAANNGTLVNFTGSVWVNDELFTLPDTIIPGVAFTSTTLTPFINGAAVINFGTVSVNVTISGGQFTATMPMPVDGGVYPKIPLTAAISLVQGANTFSIFRPIALPVGYETLRDQLDNPANFAGIIIDDPEYIGWDFNDASNPLTVNDNAYWDASSGLVVYQDSSYSLPEGSAPLSVNLIIRRGADNKTYFHPFEISASGEITTGVAIGMAGTSSKSSKLGSSKLKSSRI